jgi:FAD/FMN-containing dehydrogenase
MLLFAIDSVQTDSLVLSLAKLNSVEIDEEKQLATIGGGCLLADVDAATQRCGGVVPSGLISRTGFTGLALGGGLGYLTRKFGVTADSIVAVELVTADGRVMRVDERRDAALMFGLRGGGGNFGVVTRSTLRIRRLACGVHPLFCRVLFDGARAESVLHAYRAFCDKHRDDRDVVAFLFFAKVRFDSLIVNVFCDSSHSSAV